MVGENCVWFHGHRLPKARHRGGRSERALRHQAQTWSSHPERDRSPGHTWKAAPKVGRYMCAKDETGAAQTKAPTPLDQIDAGGCRGRAGGGEEDAQTGQYRR